MQDGESQLLLALYSVDHVFAFQFKAIDRYDPVACHHGIAGVRGAPLLQQASLDDIRHHDTGRGVLVVQLDAKLSRLSNNSLKLAGPDNLERQRLLGASQLHCLVNLGCCAANIVGCSDAIKLPKGLQRLKIVEIPDCAVQDVHDHGTGLVSKVHLQPQLSRSQLAEIQRSCKGPHFWRLRHICGGAGGGSLCRPSILDGTGQRNFGHRLRLLRRATACKHGYHDPRGSPSQRL
mmetsp:Transcript_41665/g.93307  ORF Transcript_41665/g.93307 Transcript_41665/m.93307 type:complete len:234 (-) Transcript_41665:2-703(-)